MFQLFKRLKWKRSVPLLGIIARRGFWRRRATSPDLAQQTTRPWRIMKQAAAANRTRCAAV
jgi:hypothetical protein